MWIRDKFGLKLENCPKCPDTHVKRAILRCIEVLVNLFEIHSLLHFSIVMEHALL